MVQATLRPRPKVRKLKSTSSPAPFEVTEKDPICDMATRLLKSNYHLAVGGISCQFQNGVLTIHGRVPLYYHKQLAQTLLLEQNIPEINFIINEIEVC